MEEQVKNCISDIIGIMERDSQFVQEHDRDLSLVGHCQRKLFDDYPLEIIVGSCYEILKSIADRNKLQDLNSVRLLEKRIMELDSVLYELGNKYFEMCYNNQESDRPLEYSD